MTCAAVFDRLTREFRLLVDAETHRVTWCDDRAMALGFAVGGDVHAHAVEGCDEKLRELLRRARGEDVRAWECALVIAGQPVTVVFAAALDGANVALLGSLVSQDYAEAVAEGSRAFDAIVGLNRELARQKLRLEESNTAIRALHAELEQNADRLRTAAEIKSRLVASVSHEFRTPIHSIIGISGLLLDESDGPLVPEQRTQLGFIREAARELSAMINDMLDLAKIDAGGAPVRVQAFELRDFLGAIAGTMRPLVRDGSKVELIFDPAPDVALETDHGKLAQIVRNLVANALKFTEAGTVRVTAVVDDDELQISVQDTGIGIADEDRERIFEEFVQLEGRLDPSIKGTGLGLPLARKLANLLGGRLTVASAVGVGSTFTVALPVEHASVAKLKRIVTEGRRADSDRAPVLVVEDDHDTVFVYEQYLAMAGFQVVPAKSTAAARDILRTVRPSAILLDIMLDGEDTWDFLAELKQGDATKDIPVLVCTVMNRESRARALGADEFWFKPIDEDKLVKKLETLGTGHGAKVLVIDDDPAARYLVNKYLANTSYELLEAADGRTGVELARSARPDVILLDFLLDGLTAFDVLDALKSDPTTRKIPVIIVTSQSLAAEDRRRLAAQSEAVLSKEHLSRELAIHRIRDALRTAGIREREIQEER